MQANKGKRLHPGTVGAQQHALREAAVAAAAMENTLDAKDRERRSSTDFDTESRDAEGDKNEKELVNTFSVSHSKHIHQPAMFPFRLNWKKK